MSFSKKLYIASGASSVLRSVGTLWMTLGDPLRVGPFLTRCSLGRLGMIPAVEGTGAWKWDIPDRNPIYNANIIVTDRVTNANTGNSTGDSGKAA